MDAGMTRTRLLAVREEVLAQLADLGVSRDDIVRASHDSNIDDEHDPEGATIAYERSMLQALMAQSQHKLSEIEVALGRLDEGTYEMCAVCGAPIGEARLEARPTASRCLRHA
jgi:DnaK suppressor protein